MTLLNLVTLRFSTEDLLFLELFGHLVWKDHVLVPIGKRKHSAAFEAVMVMPATKDLWAKTTPLIALLSAVNGLCPDIDLLLHPRILSFEKVNTMFRNLLHIYSKKNGKEDPDHMEDVFSIRMKQHVGEIRALDLENNSSLNAIGH